MIAQCQLPPGLREMVDAARFADWVPLEDRVMMEPCRSIRVEMASPAPKETPKREIIPAFTEPIRRPRSKATRKEKAAKPDRETCPHEKWQRQGREGTKYARYERCTCCGTTRVIGEARRPGKSRTTPIHDPATCPHLPEWHKPAKKNGGPALRCLACRSIRVSFDGAKPRRRV